MATDEEIAVKTGVPVEIVTRILAAQLDFLMALGLAHLDDDRRGEALRRKYPDLLRTSVAETAGRSPECPVEHELEATIVQLESGAPAASVVEVLAACYELNGLIDARAVDAYRRWGRKWVE